MKPLGGRVVKESRRIETRNPFEGVTDYFSELARMRGSASTAAASRRRAAERTHASAWVPATDILAQATIVIRVDLAGVDPEDVDLRFTHGALTVSGTRRPGPSDDTAEFLVRERYYGEFRRAITLPDGTDADQIRAEFEDRLVEITAATASARRTAPG